MYGEDIMLEPNESISYVNGGTEFGDINEGDIYTLRNNFNYIKWNKIQQEVILWNQNHLREIIDFKNKFK